MKWIFLLLLFNVECAFCQVNQKIIDASKDNSGKREAKSNNRNNSSCDNQSNRENYDDHYEYESDDDSYCDSEFDISACLDGCLLIGDMIDNIAAGLTKANDNILSKDTIIQRIRSFTFDIPVGNITPNSLTMMPRLRYTGGLLTTDLRVFSNKEKHLNEDLLYTTIDWQILMFNLIVEKEVNFRIGTGAMLESTSNIMFNEHSCRLDIYPLHFLETSAEFRIAPDYKTGKVVRREVDIDLVFKVYEWKNVAIKVLGSYQNASYYEEVGFDVFCFGLALDIY
ncbi:MAG: hypothetical protein JXB49_17920 [Bacteroidales bacterium]|nr:hypothetical protein [Bacteroidales bacterium]